MGVIVPQTFGLAVYNPVQDTNVLKFYILCSMNIYSLFYLAFVYLINFTLLFPVATYTSVTGRIVIYIPSI